jgi:hypothetical protein
MATEKRTSEHGTVFDVGLVRRFLLAALEHDAVTDRVHDLIFEHVMEGKYHPSVVAASLEPIITEVLGVATPEDWEWVSHTFIAQACEALGVEHPVNRAPEAQSSQTPTASRRRLRSLDPGELREKLTEIYTHDRRSSLSAACQAWWITHRISRLTGISREEIKTAARTDAEAIEAATEYEAIRTRGQSSAPKTSDFIVDVSAPPVAAARAFLENACEHEGAIYLEDDKGKEYEGWPRCVSDDRVTFQLLDTKEVIEFHLDEIQSVVEVDCPEVLINPLVPAEVLALMQKREMSRDPSIRRDAGILVAWKVDCTLQQIAAMQLVPRSRIHRVIADYEQNGMSSLEPPQ